MSTHLCLLGSQFHLSILQYMNMPQKAVIFQYMITFYTTEHLPGKQGRGRGGGEWRLNVWTGSPNNGLNELQNGRVWGSVLKLI